MSPQLGLEWRPSLFGFEPSWTVEPQTDVVKDIASKALDEEPQDCSIEFFSQGAFKKLYSIRCKKGEFMMRVSLPVDPQYKTLSEVTTIDFVQQNTDIPVPKVLAFDALGNNELGFEWILMERMSGKPLSEHWRTLSFAAKERLVKSLALFAAQLFRKRLHQVGNLYRPDKHGDISTSVGASAHTASQTSFVVGRIVSMQFFWADHISQDVPRGPFKSSQEWLSARLLFHQNDCERTLRTSDDEDDLEDAKKTSQIVRRLFSLLPSTFQPISEGCTEPTALLHGDLSRENVLVDQDGKLTAVVDWECVSALPLWKVCQLPVFLEGRERSEMPVKDNYALDENEEVNELFWDHLLEYEQTQLRRVFLNEMQRIEPAWSATYYTSSNQRKADIELAIEHSDSEFCFKLLDEWLDEFARGDEVSSLKKRLVE